MGGFSIFKKKRFGFALILFIIAVVMCCSFTLDNYWNFIISCLFSIIGTIILYSLGIHLNHFNFIRNSNSKEISKSLSICFTLISLLCTSQANSFPNTVHNSVEIIKGNIKTQLFAPEDIIKEAGKSF